jgi:luciferase family oxidoreductase group 1
VRVLPLSILDLSPIVAGSTAGEALARTRAIAVQAETLGYDRFWLTEHHSRRSASPSPEILMEHVAAATHAIRVGAGGVMLANYAPLKVAENFRVLHALHPGRIDLGIGRWSGADQATARALGVSVVAKDVDFDRRLEDLLGFLVDDLAPDNPSAGVVATPVGVPPPELWMLGSGHRSADVAAKYGLGFAYAHHFNPGGAVAAMRNYRARFRPSRHRARPYAILALSVVCAEDDRSAERLVASQDVALLETLAGQPIDLPAVEDARRRLCRSDAGPALVGVRARRVVGSPARVRRAIDQLVDETAADEVMVLTVVYDRTAGLRSFALLAEEFGLLSAG